MNTAQARRPSPLLMGMKDAVREGETLPITLTVEREGGKAQTLELHAPARARPTTH